MSKGKNYLVFLSELAGQPNKAITGGFMQAADNRPGGGPGAVQLSRIYVVRPGANPAWVSAALCSVDI
jgi:hypothetical protein